MRAYLLACLATVVIGGGGYFFLGVAQQPSGVAYTSEGARINPKWSWRSVLPRTTLNRPGTSTAMSIPQGGSGLAEECDARTAWQWIFVDFGDPEGEPDACSISQ